MREVIKIPQRPRMGNTAAKVEIKRLRVAAYCRVSTDTDEQATSYEMQISHYEEYIRSKPEWELVNVYADDGISATSTKNREEFNKMIDDCKKGLIDMIITKSISRFARNTVDCLNYIRMLKDINIPVYFEKESINTMDAKGEVMITIMASLAQQESESLSQNVKLGMQYRFQQGKPMINTTCFLGYDKDEEGNLVINPEEAEIVKRIFREYLDGASCIAICKGLERDSIKTSRGNERWHDTTIRKILENEKYMGDLLLQKTYTIDFLSKKRIKNNGDMPQYYVESNHDPIVSRETFMLVQEEIARRGTLRDNQGRRRGYSAKYCMTGITYCACCNELFKRIIWNIHGKKKAVWRCGSRLNDHTTCSARSVHEDKLQKAFVEALNQMIGDSGEYLQILQENLEETLTVGKSAGIIKIDERLRELQQELTARTENHQNYDDIADEIFKLKEHREQLIMDESTRSDYKERIQDLKKFISTSDHSITEYDETLARHMLAKVTIFEDHIVFEFKSGVAVSVEM
ncbi:MAG: recombinase family protein [Oscillospiraceae bacterium]